MKRQPVRIKARAKTTNVDRRDKLVKEQFSESEEEKRDETVLEPDEEALIVVRDENHQYIPYFLDDSQIRLSPYICGLWRNRRYYDGCRYESNMDAEDKDYLNENVHRFLSNRLMEKEKDLETEKGKEPEEEEEKNTSICLDFVCIYESEARHILAWMATGLAATLSVERHDNILSYYQIPFLQNDYPKEVWRLQMEELYSRRKGRQGPVVCQKVNVKTMVNYIKKESVLYDESCFRSLNQEPFVLSDAITYIYDRGQTPNILIMGVINLRSYNGKLNLLGGSCCEMFSNHGFGDYDFFFTDLAKDAIEADKNELAWIESTDIIASVINELCNKNFEINRLALGRSCWSLEVTKQGEQRTRKIQFILRNYQNIDEILLGFDVDACAIGYDGVNFHISKRAALSFKYKTNFLDLTRASPTYEARLMKYCLRGFNIAVPKYREFLSQNQEGIDIAAKFMKHNPTAFFNQANSGDVYAVPYHKETRPNRHRFNRPKYRRVYEYHKSMTIRGLPLLWMIYVCFQRFLSKDYMWKPVSDYDPKATTTRDDVTFIIGDTDLTMNERFVKARNSWILVKDFRPRNLNIVGFLNDMRALAEFENHYLIRDDPGKQLTSSFRSLAIDTPELWYLGFKTMGSKSNERDDAIPTFAM